MTRLPALALELFPHAGIMGKANQPAIAGSGLSNYSGQWLDVSPT